MRVTETDLMVDGTGQPGALASGGESLAKGIDSLLQDIRLEALTTEGECFYDRDYGWSLSDYLHKDFGELEELGIKNQVTQKLKRREEIDPYSILVDVARIQDDTIKIHVEFKIVNEDVSYQMDLSMDGGEILD